MTDHGARPFCDPATPKHWVRPRLARITHVELSVSIDLAACRIEGVVLHHCEFIDRSPVRVLELDQHDLDIRSVEIDGAPAAFSIADARLRIIVPTGVTTAIVRVAFASDHPAKGMYFIPADPARGQVAMCWTQGAMEDHSHWFPCFDSPNNLSTWRISVRHRAELAAVANGVKDPVSPTVDGWTTSTFVQDRPHVVYLVNVVVGEFAEVRDDGGPVPIAHHVPRGREAEGRAMFRATGFAIRWLSDFTGVAFPWRRYGHVVVHRFMWGGMENATLTTITDRVLMDSVVQEREDVDCDSLVIHELVHQWYGDLLTMKGWADIWLNESFATYLEARGAAAWRAQGDARREADELALLLWLDRRAYLDEDGGRYRRALVTNRYEDAYELFDRVAYEKGCLVLHMLFRLLGAERFRAGLTLYTTRHAHDLVETADVRQAFEDATGEPLDWFFDQWVYRPGHPRIKARWRHDPSRGALVIDIEQSQASAATAAEQIDRVYRLGIEVVWAQPGSAQLERRRFDLTRASDAVILPCAAAPVWVALDPAGDLLAEWDEDGDAAQLIARLQDGRLAADGRARAAVALGAKHAAPRTVAALAAVAGDAAAPELVRTEALTALAATRDPAAMDALIGVMGALREPRLRRALAKALGRFRGVEGVQRLAAWLIEAGDRDQSLLTAGDLFAARGAIEHPGATPLLRARMSRASWNQRLRAGCVRGLGLSGEAAAIDDVLGVLANPAEHHLVTQAACEAAGALGARHLIARDRIRRALERILDSDRVHLRMASAAALAALGDANAHAAVQSRLGREPFGNVRRSLREAIVQLAKTAAVTTALAEVSKRVDDLEQGKKRLELRLEALEKRLDAPPG